MKKFLKAIVIVAVTSLAFTACESNEVLPDLQSDESTKESVGGQGDDDLR